MFPLERYITAVRTPRNSLLRLVYIIWCVGISAYSLGSFVQLVQRYLSVHYDYKTEGVMVAAQVGFQWLFMNRSSWEERVRYMFIALTVSMVGSLMLFPLLIYNSFSSVSALRATAYFFVVVGIIFIMHHRLIVRNALPKSLSCTWVLYRLLLLFFVLVPHSTLILPFLSTTALTLATLSRWQKR